MRLFLGLEPRWAFSKDAPALGGVYKLAQDEMGPRIKLSKGKVTLPGKKQVYRLFENGIMQKDIIALDDEELRGRKLLKKVMEDGKIVTSLPSLSEIRERFQERMGSLPCELKEIDRHHTYPVEISAGLNSLIDTLKSKLIHP